MIHLLMTRPADASERFTTRLSPAIRSMIRVIHSPLLEIEPLDDALDLRRVRGLIFTSSNGVSVASELTDSRELPCYCVGRATTEAARREGWTATMAGENAETLTAFLLAARPAAPLLHLRGEHGRGNVAQTLSAGQLATTERIIYRQKLLPLTPEAVLALQGTSPVVVPLFSPRTARQFAELASPQAPLLVAALSDAVKEAVENMPNSVAATASRPDAEAMRDVVELLVRQAIRVEGPSRAH